MGFITYSHAIRWCPRRSAIEVILLNIDTVDRYSAKRYILVRNVVYRACRSRVRFDPGSVLRIEDLAVLKYHTIDNIVGFAADRANR